jgi:hypothetical protein
MLCSRQKFENMAVRVAKVKPPAAFARVQLPILKAPVFASVRNPGFLHALKDRIELTIANVKSVVVMFKRFSVVKIKGEILTDSDKQSAPLSPAYWSPKICAKKRVAVPLSCAGTIV